MLLISHQAKLAARCDRTVRLEDGRVVASLVEAVA
jgi:predicted ABC-type transport system involved in lysophospholipase L1 biosynthesis ATPase subunit